MEEFPLEDEEDIENLEQEFVNSGMPNRVSEMACEDQQQNDTETPSRFDIVKSLSGVLSGLGEGVDSKLHLAARRGDHEMASQILSGCLAKKRSVAGINLKDHPLLPLKNEYEEKPSDAGRKIAAKLLNGRNRLGATPLWLAAAAGHYDTVKVLCDHGADLEIENIKGQTPLFAAAKYNYVLCVKILLEAGANPDGSLRNISTPIFVASRENFPEVVRLLIEYGADVNGRFAERNDSDRMPFIGSVPIYMTIVYQNYECFRHLILNGAELHAAANDRGFGTSLVTGVLRHQCDVRFLKLIALCGGVRHGDKKGIDEAVSVFRQYTHGLASTRIECLEFIDKWNGNPLHLTQICRISIRRLLGQKRLRAFPSLELPRRINDYVLFSDFLR